MSDRHPATLPALIQIGIGDRHIEGADRHNSQLCPLANALHDWARVRGVWLSVNVCSQAAIIDGQIYETSPQLAEQIARFDQTGEFAPGFYSLDLLGDLELSDQETVTHYPTYWPVELDTEPAAAPSDPACIPF